MYLKVKTSFATRNVQRMEIKDVFLKNVSPGSVQLNCEVVAIILEISYCMECTKCHFLDRSV